MSLWIKETKGGILIKIHVSPRSSTNKITGLHGDALNVKLTSPAVEGKANKALISFLSDFFKIKKRQVSIKSGEKSRQKTVLLNKISVDEIRNFTSKEIRK
ncbi:MAG: DUF167 domain-containing protein [Candidatus Eremiobacteraeota bacterium]|nr:DUF167 domain-containing protein [Candidatus Eremiobacteraeota bacterium]